MAKIDWTNIVKYPQYGVDYGVLYFHTGEAVPWNGLIRVEENTETPQLEPIYFDGNVVNIKRTPSPFRAKITSYTYPKALEDHFESNASHPVHLLYRVKTAEGYQLHLVYNCIFDLTEFGSTTSGLNLEVTPFIFDVSALLQHHKVVDYPKNNTRYNLFNALLTPPPPGADPSAWEDYLRNRYEDGDGFDLDLPDFDPNLDIPTIDIIPGFNDHLDLINSAPTPHFVIDEPNIDSGVLDNLLGSLLGTPDLSPSFPSPQELLDLTVGPNPYLGSPGGIWSDWNVGSGSAGSSEFGLADSTTSLGIVYPLGQYVNNLRVSAVGDGVAVLSWFEQNDTSTQGVVVCQAVTFNGSGEIQYGPRLSWDATYDGFPANALGPVVLNKSPNARLLFGHNINTGAPSEPIGWIVSVNTDTLVCSFTMTLPSRACCDEWIPATDGQGNGMLVALGDNVGMTYWINSSNGVSGPNAPSQTFIDFASENRSGSFSHDNAGRWVGVPDSVSGVASNLLSVWEIDYSTKTASSTYISIPTMNSRNEISRVAPGTSPGTVLLAAEVYDSSVLTTYDVYEDVPSAGPAPSASYVGSINARTVGGKWYESYGGIVNGLTGYVHMLISRDTSEYILHYYANSTSTFESLALDSDWDTGGIADVGQGYFICAWVDPATYSSVKIKAGWAR